MDILKYGLIVIVFSCFALKMSSDATSTTPTTSTATSPPLSEVVYGANCDNTTQCNTTNVICNGSGICACADTHYYNTTSDTCTQKVEYGANCDKIIYCNTFNVICNGSSICVCADSHYYDTCTQEVLYGTFCATMTQCNTTNAICNESGICACAGTHFYNPTSDTCTQKMVYGANCATMTQCNTTNAICNESSICACAGTHFYNPTSDTCTQKMVYGANCDNMTQCNTTNAVCNGSGICACADTHYYNTASDTCTQKVLNGAICAAMPQCNTTNAICNESGICACADTHYYNTTSDTCAQKVVYGANCDNMTQCNTTNAVCNGSGICACADTHYYNTASNTCTQKKGFGDVCSETSQCDTTSDSKIVCIQTATDKKCLCTDGWYRPGPNPTSCTQISASGLRPVITVPPTIGIGNIDISWTNTDADTGGYTSSYTVTWSSVSPASSRSATVTQKSYNIQTLSAGTTYTVTVTHIITQYGRSQPINSVQGTFTTKQVFGGVCTDLVQCDTSDTNIVCVQTMTSEKRCLCKTGMYKPSTSASCTGTSGLKPTITVPPAIGTGNIYISWNNTDVTGGYNSTYTVTWSPASASSSGSGIITQKNYNISSLSPRTTYTVTVAHIITLYGRSQAIIPVQGTYTTKQVFGGDCGNQLVCDTTNTNMDCIQSKCLCIDGMYRPAASCTASSPLKPVITGTTGIGSIVLTWTNDDAFTGGYTSNYTVTWSPGSPGTATTTQKSYTIQPLSQGATYAVTVIHNITLYGRSQTITSDLRTFTTRIDYNGTCTQSGLCYDASASCYSGRCRCDPGYYRNATCDGIAQLRPTTVMVVEQNTTTMTATWTASSNDVVTGYEVSVTPGDTDPINVGKAIRTTPITGLTPGRQYAVNVKTKITYLRGRDEVTGAVTATTRTTPASVTGLDMTKTNRTAPDITVVFPRAAGDADSYNVTLTGRDGDTYNQQRQPAIPATGPISVVFTDVVAAVSYNLNILTQSGTFQSSPYTTVIRVQSTPAGIVNNLKSFDNTSRSVAVEWRRPLKPNGEIYEYIVDVRTGSPSVCVKRIIINCTECNRQKANSTQMEIECTTTTVVITPADINNTEHVIQYNITGLNPDTPYTIDVVAVNEEGPGTSDNFNIQTPTEGAGVPTNFKAQSKSSSEITLTWDPPEPRPGVTQYNITVYEKLENSDDYNTINTIAIPGWEISTYTIGSLSSYWLYKFDIVAETKISASSIVNSTPTTVRTMESEPTDVLELKVEKITDVFNQVQVSWKCPKQKDGRNGEIGKANLNYFTNQQSTYVEPIRMDVNFTNSGDCMWKETVDVTTEFKYFFKVRLYNRGFAGSFVNKSKDIVGGPPLQSVVMGSVRKGEAVTEETVSLNICPRCLNDRTNGQVNNTGLMVCKKGGNCGQSRKRRAITSAAEYNNIANWNVASANSFNEQYRATKPDWLDGNVGESTLSFKLGTEDCSENPTGDFCNGKLPAGVTFIVYAFTCTQHGCTSSEKIEVTTKAIEASILVPAVVGGVVAALVVIVVVIVVVVIRRRRYSKMKQAEPSLIEAPTVLIDRKRPIRMKDFEKRVEEMHKDSNLLFSEEFEDIGALSPKHACIASETGGNKLRNRYVNILPFDQSRVKLRATDDDDNEETDYINANYIPGYTSPREYIATQGPMVGTVSDFWRMIWEQDVKIIIMLSDLLEKGKPKVDKYWPDNLKEPVQHGEIIVEMINYSPLSKYVIKIFQITLGEESRKVRHYFLPGWQDFGANLTPDDVISFVRDVRMQTKPTDKGPICVHCSAGVGRTGTYVSLDVFKQVIDEENFDKEMDVFDFVMKMRENRSYMVQTEKQYIFIHDTIKEMINRKKKEIEEREQSNIYQNTGEHMKPEENIYANQAYEPDPEELYMNVTPGQPTTVL